MSIAELVPGWKSLPDPCGDMLPGLSLRGRSYRLRSNLAVSLDAAGILSARGIDGDPDVFLRPLLKRDMPSPFLLEDMRPAANRLARAAARRERVVIFGDYDVDGASSCAVLGRWLRELGVPFETYIPDRLTEGYGPTPAALERAMAFKPALLVCVDCGTAAAEALEAVDADVIVIDHHKPQGRLPDVVAVVNPHREDDRSGLGMLCATALCFMAVTAAQGALRDAGTLPDPAPRLVDLLDVVALATVADVVPLIGPSRLFVAKGLEVMARNPSPGIAALMQVSGISDVSSRRIGFTLGPRVNAGGRVGGGTLAGDGALGARLLLSQSTEEAAGIAARLDAMNRERQDVEKICLEQAMESAVRQIEAGASIVTVFAAEWHPGVVGIVAGRIRERFDVPALVGSFSDGVIKGSGRSVGGFDLGAAVVEAKRRGMLETGGGHAMACGFGCRADAWIDFERFMRKRAIWQSEPLAVDCSIAASEIDVDGLETLETLEPLGQGMPAVKAALYGLRVGGAQQLKNGHVKINLIHDNGSIDGLWWRARDEGFEETLLSMDGPVVAVGTPRVDSWQGRRRISMDLADIIPVTV